MNQQQTLEHVLKRYDLRLTQPRQVVFDFLLNQGEPVQTSQIIALAGNWADRASLYRTIRVFRDLGVINEVHRPGGYWLELGEDYSPHHHHISCSRCGISQTVTNSKLEQTLDRLATEAGWQSTVHHVEISGLCPDCLVASSNQ